MPSDKAADNGAPATPFTVPAETVTVGWLRLPSGEIQATLTFADAFGQRTHPLDAVATRTVGTELCRLARFLDAGLEPPQPGPAGPR